MNYYSPELVSYIQGSVGATDLTESSDIFALGLIYAEYLTGALPTFDPAYHEAAIAVLNGPSSESRRGTPPSDSSRWLNRCCWSTPSRAQPSPRYTKP